MKWWIMISVATAMGRFFYLLPTTTTALSLFVFLLVPQLTLSLTTEKSTLFQLTRSRLLEALSSPSGKLTLSPELIIQDPSSPTALLLQTSAITSLSHDLRTKAKANCVFLSCTSLTSFKVFCNEQEKARGYFPGPIPVIYCPPPQQAEEEEEGTTTRKTRLDYTDIVEAGACGILVPLPELSSVDDILKAAENDEWKEIYKKTLDAGLQPIPEVILTETVVKTIREQDDLIEALVNHLAAATGGQDPVSILLTIQEAEKEDEDKDEDATMTPLPAISRALERRVPILGSIRTKAGGNRIAEETARYKAAGFTGALLRRECIPGYQLNPSLEYVSNFWSACIGGLKSTKSKTFNFRSRNLMEKSVPLEWAKYQKNVIESGALGEAEDNSPPSGFNPNAGDYQGF